MWKPRGEQTINLLLTLFHRHYVPYQLPPLSNHHHFNHKQHHHFNHTHKLTGGDEVVVRFGLCRAPKQTIGQAAARSDGGGGELHISAHVAESVHPLVLGVLELVDLDVVLRLRGRDRARR
jgi:hypothetical protein